jgi:hypothetical protein
VDLIGLVSQYILFAITNNVLQASIEASMPYVTGLTQPYTITSSAVKPHFAEELLAMKQT